MGLGKTITSVSLIAATLQAAKAFEAVPLVPPIPPIPVHHDSDLTAEHFAGRVWGMPSPSVSTSSSAKAKAKESGKEPIFFIEHNELLDLFAEYGIGVRSETLKFYQ